MFLYAVLQIIFSDFTIAQNQNHFISVYTIPLYHKSLVKIKQIFLLQIKCTT